VFCKISLSVCCLYDIFNYVHNNAVLYLTCVAPDAEVTITEKTVSVKKEKVTIVGEQETRTVESSPTFSQTLMPVTEVNEGDSVK